MRFRPGQHLRRQSDIRAVREQGRRVDGRAFTVWWHRPTAEAGSNKISAMLPPNSGPERSGEQLSHSAPSTEANPPVGGLARLPRAAVIASIAAVGSAVRRNRAKRRLRELFRKHQGLIPPACDLLLIARAQAVQWRFSDLERAFVDACRRIAPSPSPTRAPAPPLHE